MKTEIDWRNFNQDEFRKLAFASRATQVTFIAVICLIILAAIIWFFARPKFELIEAEVEKEQILRGDYIVEQNKAANLEAYRLQLQQMEQNFQAMIEQLPSRSQIEGLLREVTDLSNHSGLTVKTFRPLQAEANGFYTEHSIELVVTGSFEQFANFASDLSSTSRIVNMKDYQLELETADANSAEITGDLRGNLRIATYRYNGEDQ